MENYFKARTGFILLFMWPARSRSCERAKKLRLLFGIPHETAARILHFLVNAGLLSKDGSEYYPTQKWIRIGKTSPHIVKLHSNWRQKAIQNLETQTAEDVHFSGVYSLSHETAAVIREKVGEFIQGIVKEGSRAV